MGDKLNLVNLLYVTNANNFYTLMLGKIEGRRRRAQQMMKWSDSITQSIDMIEKTLGESEGQDSLECFNPWGYKESDIT